ncbi:long-subunit acyl-CoA synthetase (AMP-forming) [Rubrivivax gelatinosus]|uniref:AMP-binding protein n=1 Tax=Rubrivivax gelatinosus TaxID=28068 RepID=UPI0018C92B2A|nr:AMP-binding protein [Rubrivivax gelatinosus]MBG6082921.1 long-subunit acyl-CoA synthetase (AMP-forming) [Rubrivivax gelatinosus]
MKPALIDGTRAWSAAELAAATEAAAGWLRAQGTRVLATLLDNGAGFVVLDDAARATGVVHVPLPLFFDATMLGHVLASAGVDTLVAATPLAARWPGLPWQPLASVAGALSAARLPALAPVLPAGTAKITYTSGSTGRPKGVCLTAAAMDAVADGLVQALAPLAIERHLAALPYAVLLENVAGLMAPRRQGSTVVCLPLAEVGLTGSSSFDPARLHAAVERHEAQSLILLPQMLRVWCGWLAASGRRAPASLRFVAVGGAAVGAPVLKAAQALGLPAYEGYGLSEGASVQTLNLPGADCPGSAGRPLPHARVRVAADGELEVAGSLFAGYVGEAAQRSGDWWPTGDLGRIDEAGFVHVVGRKKNLLITGYGRNVSPEWPETALRCQPAIAQAVVLGDGEPALSAVLWPASPAVGDLELAAAVVAANSTLPDYARVARWTRAADAFDAASGLATANGRPRRDAIHARHAEALGLGAASDLANR